jgi:hypothetical protein
MSTMTHGPSGAVRERRRWSLPLVPELWPSLAILVIWLAVLLIAIWGPDISTTTAGGDHASVPSVIPVTFFAFFATWVVAKYGFRRDPNG